MKRLLRSKLILTIIALVMIAGAAAIPLLSGSVTRSHAAASNGVLILSTTVTGGTSSFEAKAAQALGLTVNIVDPTTWDAMTTAQFKSYKAIILGDPECSAVNDTTPIDPATKNNKVWGKATTGNVIILGTDPSAHSVAGTTGAMTLISDGISFATANPGHTGAYISLSCYYADAGVLTNVPLLDAFGTAAFRVGGEHGTNPPANCSNTAHVTYTPPAFIGMKDSDLSNWSCSIHEVFDISSPSFNVLAIDENNTIPYIEVRPTTVTSAQGTQPNLIFPFNKPTKKHSEDWAVIQGYDHFTHTGNTSMFAFDLQRTDSKGNPCGDCTKNEPVLAAANGDVIFTQDSTGCIGIRHNSFTDPTTGTTRYYFTEYCHVKTPFTVTVGQTVKQGDQIGQAWNTSIPNVTCSVPCPYHIHFALFSATDKNANNNRRSEQPLYRPGVVVKDNNGQGGYVQISWPWDGSVNEYGSPMWTIRRF